MDKKTLTILGGVIGAFVLFIIILFLIAGCSKSNYTYDELKDKMISIATDYFEDKEKLPKNDGDEVKYTLEKMIENGKLKPLNELFDDETAKCEGYVAVRNNNGHFLYAPVLTCTINKEEFKTNYLSDQIIKDNLVTTGVGLYENITDKGTQYIFKGETENNYLVWGDRKYRIIRINEDGSIKLLQTNANINDSWDDRLNEDYQKRYGYNYYVNENGIKSRIKESIDKEYDYLEEEEKGYIKSQDQCIGARNINDEINDGSIECAKVASNQQYGLLSVYEYFQASLNPTCNKIPDDTCENYNWIANDINTWTATISDANNYEAYKISYDVESRKCNETGSVYPTIVLDESVIYVDGKGTEDEPYKFTEIEED